MQIYIYRVEAAKRDLAHILSSFQIISYPKRHLCPLQLSIMELLGLEFFITRTFLLHGGL